MYHRKLNILYNFVALFSEKKKEGTNRKIEIKGTGQNPKGEYLRELSLFLTKYI